VVVQEKEIPLMIKKVVAAAALVSASLDTPKRRKPLPPLLRRLLPRITIIIANTINKRPSP
jgi:hypothetical protein